MKTVSVILTLAELKLLLDYWPGDIVSMGDADANNPENKIQETGEIILDKFCKAFAKIETQKHDRQRNSS